MSEIQTLFLQYPMGILITLIFPSSPPYFCKALLFPIILCPFLGLLKATHFKRMNIEGSGSKPRFLPFPGHSASYLSSLFFSPPTLSCQFSEWILALKPPIIPSHYYHCYLPHRLFTQILDMQRQVCPSGV